MKGGGTPSFFLFWFLLRDTSDSFQDRTRGNRGRKILRVRRRRLHHPEVLGTGRRLLHQPRAPGAPATPRGKWTVFDPSPLSLFCCCFLGPLERQCISAFCRCWMIEVTSFGLSAQGFLGISTETTRCQKGQSILRLSQGSPTGQLSQHFRSHGRDSPTKKWKRKTKAGWEKGERGGGSPGSVLRWRSGRGQKIFRDVPSCL